VVVRSKSKFERLRTERSGEERSGEERSGAKRIFNGVWGGEWSDVSQKEYELSGRRL